MLAKVPSAVGLKFTTELHAVPLTNLVLTLAHETLVSDADQPTIYKALSAVKNELDECRMRRDLVAHRDWLHAYPHTTQAMEALKFTARGKLNSKKVVESLANTEKLAQRIGTLNAKLVEILMDYKSGQLVAPVPAPKKQKSKKKPA